MALGQDLENRREISSRHDQGLLKNVLDFLLQPGPGLLKIFWKEKIFIIA